MFQRLFRKRAETPRPSSPVQSPAAPPDNWTLAEGRVGDLPLLFRLRTFPPADVDRSVFRTLVVIGWSYEPGNAAGMPASSDAQRMDELEGLLDNALEVPHHGFLTVAVTGDGRREWQWYTRDVEAFMTALNQALAPHAVFPIDLSHQDDPGWTAYLSIQSAAT